MNDHEADPYEADLPAYEADRYALALKFPGWVIEVDVDETETSWSATRPLVPGHGGIVGLTSDTITLLQDLLTEAEQCDARLALRDLTAGLDARGIDDVTVRGYDTNVIIQGPGDRERLITCEGGCSGGRWAATRSAPSATWTRRWSTSPAS